MQNNQKATLKEKKKNSVRAKKKGCLSAAKYIVKHFTLLPVLGTEVQGDFDLCCTERYLEGLPESQQ